MAQARELKEREKIIFEKFQRLSPQRRQEVIDFLEFLESREKAMGWLEFDAWAIDLAKERGFDHLTEEDIARIVSDYRGGK
jgi:hypothetical protein